MLIWGTDGKVLHLPHENDTFAIDHPRVQTQLVCCRSEAELSENSVGVFLPEAWRLWVALHCHEDWDNMSGRDGGVTFMVFPPLMKRPVRPDEKALFWRRGFRKSIAHI